METLLPMFKRIIFSTLGFILFASPLVSSADVVSDLRAQIEALLSHLATLQSQLKTETGACVNLTRNIGPSSTDATTSGEVTRLQQFLAQDSSVYPEGSVTGYFGPATTRAVQRWQVAHNLVTSGSPQTTGYGYVGPRTRAAMEQLCGSSGSDIQAQAVSVQQFSCPQTFPPINSCPTGWQPVTDSRGCTNSYRCAASTLLDGKHLCTLNGQIIAHGSSVLAYLAPSVAYGSSCVAEQRVCTDGTLSGTYTASSCTISTGDYCTFNSQLVPSGSSVTAYQTVGGACIAQARICNNGVLSGSYSDVGCAANTLGACAFNGSTIPNGASRTAYETSSVPFGSVCVSQTRICNSGILSGSYTAPSCSVSTGESCVLNTQSIPNGSSVAAFQSPLISTGGVCASQIRTCTNGTLSGDNRYGFNTCTTLSPNAPVPTTFVPRTYNGIGIQLHAWFTAPAGQGPYPTIILAHGCNGVNPNDSNSGWSQANDWATFFRQSGYATFIVDSFTARGKFNGICDNGGAVSLADRASDLYAAATVLTKMREVNPRRIGIFGVSHGAATVASALRNYPYVLDEKATLGTAGGGIRAGAALYPDCDLALSIPSFHTPLFLATGSADDWLSPLKCEALTNFPVSSSTPVDITSLGSLVRIIVYPGVTHAFDIVGSTFTHPNSLGYRIAYNPAVTVDVRARIKTFFDSFLR